MSHRSRVPSAVMTNAPFRVPTSSRTPLIAVLLPYCRSAQAPIDTSTLLLLGPPRSDGVKRDLATPLGAEGLGPGAAAFQSAKPPQLRGVGIAHGQGDAAAQHLGPFRRGLAVGAGLADGVGALGLVHVPLPIADEAAALHAKQRTFT